MKLAIIDYGSGNLKSVYNTVKYATKKNTQVEVTDNPNKIKKADRIILPGVGAFADCRNGIYGEIEESMRKRVEKDAVPFLGICVGMQLMAEKGREKGTTKGFGWISGEVTKMKPKENQENQGNPRNQENQGNPRNLKIPQIGWNDLYKIRDHPLLNGIKLGKNGLNAYFVHSYQMKTEKKNIIATTEYGGTVTAMVAKNNMAGTQFHPEKSQKLGIKLLYNFLEWNP